MSDAHADLGPELRALAQSILNRIDPAVRAAAAAAAGADGPGKCQQVWCPVCALAALVSGEQHPLLTVIAEHSVGAADRRARDGRRHRVDAGPAAAAARRPPTVRQRRVPAGISTSR